MPGSRSMKGPHHNNLKLGRRLTKGSHSKLETDPAKNDVFFCDGEVFSLDRGLLMGAILTSPSISILITYIVFLTEMQKRQIPEKGFALVEKRYQ